MGAWRLALTSLRLAIFRGTIALTTPKITRFDDIPPSTRSGQWECDFGLDRVVACVEEQQAEAGLNLDPDFQRGHVWTARQQVKFIEFLLRGGRTACSTSTARRGTDQIRPMVSPSSWAVSSGYVRSPGLFAGRYVYSAPYSMSTPIARVSRRPCVST